MRGSWIGPLPSQDEPSLVFRTDDQVVWELKNHLLNLSSGIG
jgi:hypothetical protein